MFLLSWISVVLAFVLLSAPKTLASQPQHRLLQDIVTYDEYSIKINGTRLFIFSGEFHPFRLPVPGLWLDIFQKVKAVGFNTVSFYADWALLEGKQGNFSAEGIFDFEPFFDAAKQAGLYLIARPGPYINAESSGGGFPGWLNRITGYLREANPAYLDAVQYYESQMGAIVAKGQITKGGPVILLQPENEYSSPESCLSHPYMADVEKWFRNAGVVVPTISNDGYAYGNFAPGTGLGSVDIYGYDSYPLGFDCAEPYVWSGLQDQYFPGLTAPEGTPSNLPAANPRWNVVHEIESPTTPDHVSEFQGGSFDSWGGAGFDKCATMTNAEFERVFYKNSYSFGLKGINYYMIYGGTNWGNLGFPYGYTSYDYGAAIKEDRTLMREKYPELKLQANFFKVSPAWFVAYPHNFTNHSQIATTDAITVTALTTDSTSFYVIRHSNYSSMESTSYSLQLTTSSGNLTVPQLGGSLMLNGRDSKIMVTDYKAGNECVLYSTAEVYTWQQYSNKTLLLLYTGPDETNEVAFKTTDKLHMLEGKLLHAKTEKGVVIVQWQTSSQRAVFQLGELEVYMLDRYSAYDYWVLSLGSVPQISDKESSSVVLRSGYLVRNATISGDKLQLFGDTNTTTTTEVIGTPQHVSSITWNRKDLSCKQGNTLACEIPYSAPSFKLPELAKLDWKYADSLPEIQPAYDDSKWTSADHSSTNDTQQRNLTTPTSLYSSDYGYDTGALLYRTHFISTGHETEFNVETQGGSAFGVSVWVNETFLGSWAGSPADNSYYQNLSMPKLTVGESYTITLLQDMMGFEESGPVGPNASSKTPRGILNYNLVGHEASSLKWRLTGNLGGEDYHDRSRGPLNEGGLYAERQGWYQPYPPIHSSAFSSSSPMDGIPKPGVAFYTASFTLDMPQGWDIPLSFVFANNTSKAPTPYRCLLFVNGYQFGKYLNSIGPQTSFPVPEGILNYHGENWVAMTLWASENGGARLESLTLEATAVIQSGYGSVPLSPMARWNKRPDAY